MKKDALWSPGATALDVLNFLICYHKSSVPFFSPTIWSQEWIICHIQENKIFLLSSCGSGM